MLVDCRIGSLEILSFSESGLLSVDCRIGSLETVLPEQAIRNEVDCRIGSLEKSSFYELFNRIVDCRIGGRIGTPAGMQEGKMKKAPLAGAFFDGLFSPWVCSLCLGLYGRCGLSAVGTHRARR